MDAGGCSAEDEGNLGFDFVLRCRARGCGGVRPMVDHTLGIPTSFLGVEQTRIIGVVLIIVGALGLLDSFARFALQGLGTPAPIPPTRNLVVTGLYRYVRNPMYFAVVAVIFGQAVLFGDWRLLLYGPVRWLACHLFVITYEEPTLRRTHAGSMRPIGPMSRD